MSFTNLEAFIFEKMSETKLPGLSVAIVEGDAITWSRGIGVRDLEHGLPATPHTLYGIGSVTKSFTALAIMQLAEAGKLSLEDPVEAHIPFDIRPQGQPVRIWHLLTHSSGIPALAYAESLIRGVTGAGENWLPIASYADLLTFMRDAGDWVLTAPGERWFYLNEGYQLLGYIIEQRSGMRYQEYVRQHILSPLGMTRSFFSKEEVEQDQDVAIPYVVTQDGRRLPSTYPYGSIAADGGLISSVLDLAKYISMYLGWGEYDGARLLARSSVEAMETPRVDTPLTEGPFGQAGYAYGLAVTPDFLGHKLVGHGGSVLVSTAYMGFIPEKGVGVALLANGSGYPLSQFGMVALAILLGAEPEELPFVAHERALSELEGTYETYKGTMQAQVKRQGDFLRIEIRDRYTELITLLIPDRLEQDRRTFYTLQAGHKLPVEFRVQNDKIDLIFERYRLRKVSR